MIHTCPRCELRFASDTELTDHLKIDHHADPEEFDRLHYKPKPVRPTGRRYLLLANRTLEEPWLLPRVARRRRRAARTSTSSWRPRPSRSAATGPTTRVSASRRTASVTSSTSSTRPASRPRGRSATPDPLRAVTHAIEHQPADEILVATLPLGASRWLDVDLPATLHRRFSVPVTTLTDQLTTAATHTFTSGRSCSIFAGPMPRTSARSSTDRNGPCCSRWSMIACASAGPMPGSASRSAALGAVEIDRPVEDVEPPDDEPTMAGAPRPLGARTPARRR